MLPLTSQTSDTDGQRHSRSALSDYPSPKHLYIAGGFMHLGTDVKGPRFTGWGVGAGYQNYLTDLRSPFFIRLGLFYGVDQDIDANAISDEFYGMNEKLEEMGYSEFVRNYTTNIIGLQANIGYDFWNIMTEDRAQRFGMYVLAGPDVIYYTAKYDALDANGAIYDFSGIDFDADNAAEQVAEIMDGNYETKAPNSSRFGLGLNLGIGFRYHFTPSFGLGLEHMSGITFADDLDGFESNDQNDSINHTRLFVYIGL